MCAWCLRLNRLSQCKAAQKGCLYYVPLSVCKKVKPAAHLARSQSQLVRAVLSFGHDIPGHESHK